MKKRIVLLGCGYTSVWCYKSLQRNIGRMLAKGEVEVVLLSDTAFHSFHGFTGEFLNGFLPLDFRKTSYQEIMQHARLIQGRAVEVNPLDKEVHYQIEGDSEIHSLTYDELVVGVGSFDNEETVYGLREHGLSVKKAGGLEACRERILHSLTMASEARSEEEIEKYLTFAVVGGGFAAVEVCGNLEEYLGCLKKHFPILAERAFKLYLIHSGADILPEVKKGYGLMRRYTKKVLSKAGIIILANSRLAEVEEEQIRLQDGTCIPTAVTICALGQKVVPISSTVPFERAATGHMIADECLRAKGFDSIWVGGDIAEVKRPYFEGVCRKDALWAVKHGSRIDKNIARKLKGKKPGKFAYPGLGQTASFGQNKAILELYGIQLIGILAWISRIGFFLYFMPSRKKAFVTLLTLFKKRDLFPEGYQQQNVPMNSREETVAKLAS